MGSVHAARKATWAASAYGATAVHVAARSGCRRGAEERLAFVVGSPRSGTSFHRQRARLATGLGRSSARCRR